MMKILIDKLREDGVLHSDSVVNALIKVDRADFVPSNMQNKAYEDIPLPIGQGQTISQPYTVVFMLECLMIQPGNIVLEAGYGSGWQTALLADLVGDKGHVYAFEIVPKLCNMGKENILKYPNLSSRVNLFCSGAEYGYGEGALFDRIIAAAEIGEVPNIWREQLARGGRMVYPQGGDLVTEVKTGNGSFKTERYPGFSFVPFIQK